MNLTKRSSTTDECKHDILTFANTPSKRSKRFKLNSRVRADSRRNHGSNQIRSTIRTKDKRLEAKLVEASFIEQRIMKRFTDCNTLNHLATQSYIQKLHSF